MNTSALSRLSLGFQHQPHLAPIASHLYIYSYTCNKPPRLRARIVLAGHSPAILDRWLSPPDGFTAGHNRFYRSLLHLSVTHL